MNSKLAAFGKWDILYRWYGDVGRYWWKQVDDNLGYQKSSQSCILGIGFVTTLTTHITTCTKYLIRSNALWEGHMIFSAYTTDQRSQTWDQWLHSHTFHGYYYRLYTDANLKFAKPTSQTTLASGWLMCLWLYVTCSYTLRNKGSKRNLFCPLWTLPLEPSKKVLEN